MTLQIHPGESRVLPDVGAIIKTRCPMSDITDEMIVKRAHAENLTAGDKIIVQCMDFERTTVLSHREYLVVSRVSKMKTEQPNDRESRTFEAITYLVEPLADWFVTKAGKEAAPKVEAPAPAPPPAKTKKAA